MGNVGYEVFREDGETFELVKEGDGVWLWIRFRTIVEINKVPLGWKERVIIDQSVGSVHWIVLAEFVRQHLDGAHIPERSERRNRRVCAIVPERVGLGVYGKDIVG